MEKESEFDFEGRPEGEKKKDGVMGAVIVGFICASILGAIGGAQLAKVGEGAITTEEIKDGTITLSDVAFFKYGKEHAYDGEWINTGFHTVYAFSVKGSVPGSIVTATEDGGVLEVSIKEIDPTLGIVSGTSQTITWFAIGSGERETPPQMGRH